MRQSPHNLAVAFDLRLRGWPVGAGNYVTSCDLRIFMDETAEQVALQHLDIRVSCGRMGASGGRVQLQCPAQPVNIVMARRTVFLETPSFRAIALLPRLSDRRRRRISAHSSKEITDPFCHAR